MSGCSGTYNCLGSWWRLWKWFTVPRVSGCGQDAAILANNCPKVERLRTGGRTFPLLLSEHGVASVSRWLFWRITVQRMSGFGQAGGFIRSNHCKFLVMIKSNCSSSPIKNEWTPV
ncbi:hypothetical protein BN1002_03708 [Bacillus sp. B-jedd]|nr:hypothetical protein BN1002_03708 [Bacillus sp. B-jedd]